jgi:hypothetical protein
MLEVPPFRPGASSILILIFLMEALMLFCDSLVSVPIDPVLIAVLEPVETDLFCTFNK